MILHTDNKNKFIVLAALVVFVAGVVFWQWSQFFSWPPADQLSRNNPWQGLQNQASDVWQEFSASFGLAKDQFDDLQEELTKEQKRLQLLEFTQQYIAAQEQAEQE
jgi:hypothetical protein